MFYVNFFYLRWFLYANVLIMNSATFLFLQV